MRKTSVVLIEPMGNTSNVFENYMQLPLTGVLYLGTILDKNGYDVTILNEHILGRHIDLFQVHADVYCISALSVSANRTKLLAAQFRRIYPQSRIIIGGIHASLLPDEFTDVADHIVIGEAEDIIVDLVAGNMKEQIVTGKPVEDMNSLPLINFRLLQGYENFSIIPIMTSRGCPFDCNFCTVTKIFGRKFRMQSVERIIEEIKHALSIFKTRQFFFYDDNFTTDRKRIHEFCDTLLSQKIEITWDAQVRSDMAKQPDLLAKMARAGCTRVYVGFESISDETLKALKKSQTKKDIEDSIRMFHTYGIKIHGMFMFGEDNDTLDTIHDTVDFALKHEIDTVQFMILTPFPGTRIYDKIVAEKRLYHKNWDYYDGMYTVFQPKNLTAVRLQEETVKAYKRFYSIRRTAINLLDFSFNILLDSLVWNFRRAFRYSLEIIFMRIGSIFIINRFTRQYTSYSHFLNDIEESHSVKQSTSQ